MQAYGPAVLRLVVGAVFAAHGAQKLFGLWGGGGLAGTVAFFAFRFLSTAPRIERNKTSNAVARARQTARPLSPRLCSR